MNRDDVCGGVMDVSSSVFSFALDWSNSMHTIISTHKPKEISLPNRFFPDTSLWQPVDFLSPSLHSLSDSLFHLHNFFFFLTSYRLPQTAHSLAPHNNQQPSGTHNKLVIFNSGLDSFRLEANIILIIYFIKFLTISHPMM